MSTVLQRSCVWCKAPNFEGRDTHCASCGGPLPSFPRQILRENPELLDSDEAFAAIGPGATPRTLPAAYTRRVLTGDTQFMLGWLWLTITGLVGLFGVIMVCVFPPLGLIILLMALVFTGVGISVMVRAAGRIVAALRALKTGSAAQARVLDASVYTVTTIRYQFHVGGQAFEHSEDSRQAMTALLEAEDRIWVVYNPTNPAQCRLWPPV